MKYSHELKIKALSLGDEGKRIRQEELKARSVGDSAARTSLYLHRIHTVRPYARSAHLAYGYTRRLSYAQMERFAYTKPNFKEIEKLIRKYAKEDPLRLPFETWLKQAEQHIEAQNKPAPIPAEAIDMHV